jgi:hypothetical protein
MTAKSSGTGWATVEIHSPSQVRPGQNMTFFINIPNARNWSYVQAFAQDGPSKNYRWTSNGYNLDQVIAGEWNSIVVPIPSDFAASGGNVGISIYATGSGTIPIYVDAISFQN